MIPKTLMMFPDARFIHIYRNGPAVVESMYRRAEIRHRANRAAPAPNYQFRLQCARYWNDCLLEMARVNQALGLTERNVFWECSYEALCEEPSRVLGGLADYLGLDPALFSFDRSQIISANYKVEGYNDAEAWIELLRLMHPAMLMKGYAE